MLELRGIVAGYGAATVLRGIDLEAPQGQITCLLGGNAAGKSTMMKTIIGLVRPASGAVLFEGAPLNALATSHIVRRGIALVPEGRRIFGRMTVWENLAIGAHLRAGEPKAEIDADIERIYGLFPRLRERTGQVAGTMSGGEQQMLAIGRALMTRPRLLLMDEPSMGLSPAFVDQVFDIIGEINRQGMTILLVEQNANMALTIAARAYVLQSGRIVASGAAAELLGADDVRRAYLGEA